MSDDALTVVGTEPCPKCGSPDNLKRYADGHAHCFTGGCGYHESAKMAEKKRAGAPPHDAGTGGYSVSRLLRPAERPEPYPTFRSIPSAVRRRFGVFHSVYGKDRTSVVAYPVYHGGTLVGQKLRFPDKQFVVLKGEGFPKGLTDCDLFGLHVWAERFDRRVVVTTGEEDAMAIADATDGKLAVVSVTAGDQGALANLKANYRWLDRFEEIILWFDDDDSGRGIVDACASLFEIGKVRLARIDGYKDANAALEAKRAGDITKAVYAGTKWLPKGILSATDVLNSIDWDAPPPKMIATPWPGYNAATHGGFSSGDLIFMMSGAGVGKTTALLEFIYWQITEEGNNVGAVFFEDQMRDLVNGLLTVKFNKRLRLDETLVPSAKRKKAWEAVAADNRIFLFDGQGGEWTFQSLLANIRYLAKACDCAVVVIDPFSYLVALMNATNERQSIDEAVARLALLQKQLGICILVSHHLTRPDGDKGHEEGAAIALKQARGSNAIGQFSTLDLGLRWHPDHEVVSIDVLKSRRQGELKGKEVAWLKFDPDTGRVRETAAPSGNSGGFGSIAGRQQVPADDTPQDF